MTARRPGRRRPAEVRCRTSRTCSSTSTRWIALQGDGLRGRRRRGVRLQPATLRTARPLHLPEDRANRRSCCARTWSGWTRRRTSRRATNSSSRADGKRPAVEAIEVVTVGTVSVGITAVVGKDMYEQLKKIDPTFGFLDNADVLEAGAGGDLDAHPKKPAREGPALPGVEGGRDRRWRRRSRLRRHPLPVHAAESEPPQFPTAAERRQDRCSSRSGTRA